MTTDTTDDAPTVLDRLDQAQWEAPELRPTFTAEGDREVWPHPCPTWCTGEGPLHEAEANLGIDSSRFRVHRSTPFRVRVDRGRSFYTSEGRHDGIRTSCLEARLTAGIRFPDRPYIQIESHYGVSGEEHTHRHAPLHPDEVRELIAVLQHLLKVATT